VYRAVEGAIKTLKKVGGLFHANSFSPIELCKNRCGADTSIFSLGVSTMPLKRCEKKESKLSDN